MNVALLEMQVSWFERLHTAKMWLWLALKACVCVCVCCRVWAQTDANMAAGAQLAASFRKKPLDLCWTILLTNPEACFIWLFFFISCSRSEIIRLFLLVVQASRFISDPRSGFWEIRWRLTAIVCAFCSRRSWIMQKRASRSLGTRQSSPCVHESSK